VDRFRTTPKVELFFSDTNRDKVVSTKHSFNMLLLLVIIVEIVMLRM
jgi:hypothetical protein